MTPRQKCLVSGLSIALGLGVALASCFYLNFLSTLQLRASDLLFLTQTQSSADSKIAIVGIDDKSLADLGQFQSWPRSYYAQVVDALSGAGARAIVIDVLFSEPGEGDAALAQAITAAGTVIMPEAQKDSVNASGVLTKSFLTPLPELAAGTYALGAANISDADVVRKLPVEINDGADTEVPAISLAAVAEYLGRPSVLESEVVNSTLAFNGRIIPLTGGNELTINYKHASNGASAFTQRSFSDVMNGSADLSVFKDKIVLIGATATGLTGLGDDFWTPLGRMNGVEIHANAISMILEGSFLKPVSLGWTAAAIVLLSLACAYMAIRWKLWKALAACTVLFLGCVLAASIFFDGGSQLNLFYPPAAVLGSVLAVNSYNVAAERRQKGEITKTFGRYVSPTVAEKILGSIEEGELRLGGREQEVTVMFADVRGYTALSRSMETPALVTLLNYYLSAIIGAVIENEGIVNKFAGDNIMAVWNAPEPCREHAYRAARAALSAQEALAAVWAEHPDLPRMEFGIGINTGSAVAGNMGSEDRLEYSVIGDTVNYASRITDAAPANRIWIGAATYEMIKDVLEAAQVEDVTAKGGRLPFAVFEVTGLKDKTRGV
jgi:adenylate cyclase